MYFTEEKKNTGLVPPIPTERLTDYPWFIPSCSNRTDAALILKSCPTIEVRLTIILILFTIEI